MTIPEPLRRLLTAAGPSGYERAPAAVFADIGKRFSEDVRQDLVGSVVASVPGLVEGAPELAVIGHIDEIGLIITHVDDQGFLRFTGVGGWDPQILQGQRVEVLTRDGALPGVVGKKPIHLLREEERKKVPEVRELYLDVGARDGEEARVLVRVGDVAVIAGEPVGLRGARATSRAMDNRLGAFIALEAARLVAEAGGSPGRVSAVGAVQEEITFAGSRTSAYALDPDVAIVVDVTHATDAPGIDVSEQGKHELGGGAVIERGSIINPVVFELLHDTAEREGIPFTVSASAARTGTDADAVHFSRAGVPTGIVSIALRYMHSPVETVELTDIDACARLIAAFAQSLIPATTFQR